MNSINTWRFPGFQLLGCGYIGQDHKLFNETMTFKARPRMNVFNVSFFSQENLLFGNLQVKGTAKLPGLL